MKTKVLAGLAFAILAAYGQSAEAQYYGYGCCPYYGSYYSGAYGGEFVPYFSLHPPVYYSQRVARTYGYSPFAYPPGVLTPGSDPAPWPPTVQNVYSGGASEQTETQPLRIDNPYVEQPARSGVTKNRPTPRKPQVVYPAAMAQIARPI